MKTTFQRLYALPAMALLIGSFCSAQTKLNINGARFNIDTGVVVSVNDLSLNNSTITLTENLLKVAGAITTTSGIDATNGTIEMNGKYEQQIAANTFITNAIKNIIITSAAKVTVAGKLDLTDMLTLNAGELAGGGYFSLKSTLYKTAHVAPVADNAVVAGTDLIVERYIPAKRAFRFLTAPVNTTGDIRSNWMENVNNTSPYIHIDPNPGYGTQITGQGGGTNGFDATNTSNPSMFGYNNATEAWVRIPNTFAQMHAGEPFRILIRGDRTTDVSINNPWPSITTLRAKGALMTGTIVFAATGGTTGMPVLSSDNAGYSFIGNPYASAIDWEQLERNDVSGTMYIFDPMLSGSNGRGAYVAYNASTGINNPSSLIDNNIQSGQSFFIKNSGSNPSLTVKESHKTGAHRMVFRTTGTLAKMSFQLLLPGQDTTSQSADGVSLYFNDNFTNGLGDEDSYKYYNPDENLSIVSSDSLLSIEGRKPVLASDTVPLKIWQMNAKSYLFKSVVTNFDPSVTPYLEDTYLQTVSVLSNAGETYVPFTITTDSLSYAANRFRIIFRTAGTLSVSLTGIKAYEKNKGIQVDWSAASETNMDRYEIEKSVNAQQFVKAGQVQAKNLQLAMYDWFDEKPFAGNNYYRIKSVSNTGEIKYSAIVKVRLKQDEITLMASATTATAIAVQMKNAHDGNYAVSIINNAGQQVYKGSIAYTTGNTEVINLSSSLAAGIYHLRILVNGKIYSAPVLVK